MKRFLVFAGDTSYPSGGWKDFVGSFDTEVDAYKALATINKDWCHLIDSSTGAYVFQHPEQ